MFGRRPIITQISSPTGSLMFRCAILFVLMALSLIIVEASGAAQNKSDASSHRYMSDAHGLTVVIDGRYRVCAADPPQPNHGALFVVAVDCPEPVRLPVASVPALLLELEYNAQGLDGDDLRYRACRGPDIAVLETRWGRLPVCQSGIGADARLVVTLQWSNAAMSDPIQRINGTVSTHPGPSLASSLEQLAGFLDGMALQTGFQMVSPPAQ